MTTDLASRIQRPEDRVAISERVVNYARAIDLADWGLLADCFTDPVHIDFSEAGMPASDFPREQFVGFARPGPSGFAARHHLGPNHVTEFGAADPDRAICHSYMYAQHFLPGSQHGDFYLTRGWHTNHMLRTAQGWKIERVVQHVNWVEGNKGAPMEAMARFQAKNQG